MKKWKMSCTSDPAWVFPTIFLFLIERLQVPQVSAKHNKSRHGERLDFCCFVPVLLLVDELNSLCGPLRFNADTPATTGASNNRATSPQHTCHMHLAKHATPSHERHQRLSHCHMCRDNKKSHIRPQHMHATTPTVESLSLPPPTAPHPPNQRAHHRMTSAHRQQNPQPSRSSRRANNGHPQRDIAPFRFLFRVGVTCPH